MYTIRFRLRRRLTGRAVLNNWTAPASVINKHYNVVVIIIIVVVVIWPIALASLLLCVGIRQSAQPATSESAREGVSLASFLAAQCSTCSHRPLREEEGGGKGKKAYVCTYVCMYSNTVRKRKAKHTHTHKVNAAAKRRRV